MTRRTIILELLPCERTALLRWNFTPEVRAQLEALVESDAVESITTSASVVRWLESDLNHAILRRGCRDEAVIALADRLGGATCRRRSLPHRERHWRTARAK